MEYDHGRRVTPLPHDLTPLERAVLDYEREVDQLHKDRAKICSTGAERCVNDEQLKRRRLHLDNRRRDLVTQAKVQEGLHKYRQRARKDNNDWIYEEEYHPTGQLVCYMESEGDVKPANNCDAHHIIPGRGWQSADQLDARLKLHDCNIGINDPRNGVWLPAKIKDVPHYMPHLKHALPHAPLHTKAYEAWAWGKIKPAFNEQTAQAALTKMRLLLLDGMNSKALIDTLTPTSRKRLEL